MKCQKCGKRLRKSEKFCTVCGYYNGDVNVNNDLWESAGNLLEDDLEDDTDKFEDIDLDKDNEDDELDFSVKENTKKTKKKKSSYTNEDLLEAYIGEDYKSIKKSPFSIWAFLLNWMYFLYRKLYITGIIGLILTGIVILYYSKNLLIIGLITIIVQGLIFNKYYIFIAKKRVKRIINKSNETDKFNLANICMEKGGVNVLFALLAYAIFLAVIIFNLLVFAHHEKFWEENSANKATCNSLIKTAYREMINQEEVGKIEEAVCKVIRMPAKKYSLYLRTKKNSQIIYSYFITEDDKIVQKIDTKDIEELRIKRMNKTITGEEREDLIKKEELEATYNEIREKSVEEDKEIKEDKNTKEKANYVFSSEEIIR